VGSFLLFTDRLPLFSSKSVASFFKSWSGIRLLLVSRTSPPPADSLPAYGRVLLLAPTAHRLPVGSFLYLPNRLPLFSIKSVASFFKCR
jgi:hypothetical protein